jgi:hypothetical protein
MGTSLGRCQQMNSARIEIAVVGMLVVMDRIVLVQI